MIGDVMRILVCGGRDYNDQKKFNAVMKEYDRVITTLISGRAKGADSLAEDWAARHMVNAEIYPADWRRYGRSAGYQRNLRMRDEGKPDLVIAFPGGRGTAMMIKLAEEKGIKVRRVWQE
jgi:hypothetical protein